MAGQFGLDNIASLYDPSVAVDQLALQRRMEIAKALRQQSMTPVDTAGRQIGGMGYRVSPMEGIAKIVQALSAQHLDSASDADRLALSQKMAMALRGALDDQGGQPPPPPSPSPLGGGGSPDPNSGLPAGVTPAAMTAGRFPQPAPQAPQPAPQAAPAPAANRMTLAALIRGGMINDIGGAPMGTAYAKNFETPEAIRVLNAEGVDPKLMGAATLGKAQKEANAPTRLGPTTYADASGQVHGLPQAVPGSVNVPNPNVLGGWQTVQVPGAAGAIESGAAAGALGKAQGTPFSGVDRAGQPLPVQSLASVLRATAPDAVVPPAVQAQRDDKRLATLNEELSKTTDPADRAAIQKEIAGTQGGTAYVPPKSGVYAAPPLGAAAGAEAGAKNSQSVMKDDYAALSSQSSNAKTVISRLQTIKQLGPQAITGAESDKRDFLNGLLSLAGYKPAIDAKTASDLIDKNAAQIALAIGAGSQGTDALRSLALAANPGRHMQDGAMQQAADSLIGPLQMTLSKTQLLTPHFTSGDATNYLSQKQAFEKAADPRIWELQNLSPAQQQAYVSRLSPSDAKQMLNDRGVLKQMGIFQ